MKKYTTVILAGMIVLLSAVLFGVLVFMKNQPPQERAFQQLVEIKPMEPDSELWGQNFPNQYSTLQKTASNNIDTEYAGSSQFSWLERDPRQVIGDALFEAETDEMVVVKDIELYALCEHHLAPFFGKAHVAYIPNGKIVGLSKIARVVDVFARRLQVQERLTMQVARAIDDVLKPRGVGVVIEASHLCMMMRGVEKQNSKTVTSCLLGLFRSDERTRTEFLKLIRG